MRRAILVFVVLLPFPIFSVFLGNHRITIGLALLFSLAGFALIGMLTRQIRMSWKDDGWLLFPLLFLAVGVVGLVLSPFGSAAASKGIRQVVGVVGAMAAVVAITNGIRQEPGLLLKVTRLMCVALGVMAGIGIVQFVVVNLTRNPSLFSFEFMNDIMGGTVWRPPGAIGSVYRASSVVTESVHFAHYLGLASGPSLIRLGLLGPRLRRAISEVVPIWAAALVLVGFLVSVSLVGYFLVFVAVLSLVILSARLRGRRLVVLVMALGILVGLLALVAHVVGPDFREKLRSIGLIWTAPSAGVETIGTYDISGLTLAVNVEVMQRNLEENPIVGAGLGAHPWAYERYAPTYARESPLLAGLNAEDAGSLLVRLLSETGLLGTAAFLLAIIIILVRSRGACLSVGKPSQATRPYLASLHATAIGIGASCAAMALASLARFPLYYPEQLWLVFGLTAAAPAAMGASLSSRERGARRRPRTRVGISCLILRPGRSGSNEPYIVNLVENLCVMRTSSQFLLFVNRKNRHLFEHLADRNVRLVHIPSAWRPIRIMSEQLVLPVYALLAHLDVMHFPGTVGAVLPIHRGRVVTVHYDLSEQNVKAMSRPKRLYLSLLFSWSCRAAERLIVPSATLGRELFERWRLRAGSLRVIYHGVISGTRDTHIAERTWAAFGLQPGFVLAVTTSLGYKNLDSLVEAYVRIRQSQPDPLSLVIAGDVDRKVIDTIGWTLTGSSWSSLREDVVTTGYLPQEEVADLYVGASVFVNTSLREAASLTVIEAMAKGTPVVASNIDVHKEILGDAAVLVDPHSVVDLSEAILRFLGSSRLRKEYAQRGIRRAANFSWEHTAIQTLAVYGELADSTRESPLFSASVQDRSAIASGRHP